MSRVRPGLVIFLFALLSVLPFLPALEGEFLLDDVHLIQNNARVQSWAHAGDWFTRGFWELSTEETKPGQFFSSYYRPWVIASYAWDWWWGGGSPVAFHVSNLVWAALCNALALLTAWRWFQGAWLPALFAASVFAFHPSKAESVAWISGRPDVLLTVGCLVALLGFSRYLQKKSAGFSLQLLGTVLAYGSKEHAVMLPLLLGAECALLYLTQLQLEVGDKLRQFFKRASLPVLAQLAVALLYLVARFIWYPLQTTDLSGMSSTYRVGLVLESAARYFELLVWPVDMAIFRAELPLAGTEVPFFVGYRLLGAFLVPLFVFGFVVLWRKQRQAALFLLLFLGLLAPVLNLRPMGTTSLISPRFLFLPLLAWGCMGAALLKGSPRVQKGLFVLVATVGLGLTTARAADFSSAKRFWTKEFRSQPQQIYVLTPYALEEAKQGQPVLAFARLHCFYEYIRPLPEATEAAQVLLLALNIYSQNTSDLQQEELKAAATFLEEIVQEKPSHASLWGVSWHYQATPAERFSVSRARGRVQALLAQLEQRLDNGEALVWAERAVQGCPDCVDILEAASTVALREQNYVLARSWHQRAGGRQLTGQTWKSMDEYIAQLEKLEKRAEEALAGSLEQERILLERDILAQAWGRAGARLLAHPRLVQEGELDMQVRYLGALAKAGHVRFARAQLESLLTSEEFEFIWQTLKIQTVFAPYELVPPFVPGTCLLPEEAK